MTTDPLSRAVDFIIQFEGFRAAPYQDVGGSWTIGYGMTEDPRAGNAPVTGATPHITEPDARKWLKSHVAVLMATVRRLAVMQLTDGQAIALTSFAYNFGIGKLGTSTLLVRLNHGVVLDAALEFPKWVHVDGRIVKGLIRRRFAEGLLFLE